MPDSKWLSQNELADTVAAISMRESVAERARRRVKAEFDRRKLNQIDIAGQLGWSQSKISKIMNGITELCVDDLDALCFAAGISVTEAVRDPGMEFCAEMTPSELRLHERIKTTKAGDAIAQLLNVRTAEPRRAMDIPPRKKKRA